MNDTKSRASRKVAVLGPIPRDQVVTHAGERFEKYGCVMYTAVALSALLDAGDTIVPISHVRRRDEGPIKQILGSFPNIDTSGITSPADQGDVVELRYVDQNRRVERQANFMNPILPADVDQVLDADAFVCIPITDYEVGQPTLRHIKEHSRATVVLDAHGPTTTLTRSGERHPRVWADQDLWLPYIDILKMNLDEAGSAPSTGTAPAGSLGSSSIASRWSTSWTRPVPATRSPGDWPTATSPTGITSWPASTGMRWALSAVPARN
jgi:hypothetical protein